MKENLIRSETWGKLFYNFEEDAFSATIISGQKPYHLHRLVSLGSLSGVVI